jgi:hypothetical protein
LPSSLISSRRRSALAAAAIASACLLAVSVALAALPGTYRGTSDDNRPVTFNLRDGKVRNFNGGITLYCFTYGEPGRYVFDATIPPRALAVRNGRFDYEGKDRPGVSKIKIHGRFVSRRKAVGTLEMSSPPGCAGEAKFTATRRG